MNPQQLRDLDRYLTTPPDWDDEPTDDGYCELDEQPAPEPAAPAYDVDAPDSEWDGVPVTTVAMALDVLRSGRTLMAQCGPLQVALYISETGERACFDVWNTETCCAVYTLLYEDFIGDHMHAYGHVAAGAWRVHCPPKPDGAPLY